MSARIDYMVGGEAGYTGADSWGVTPADYRDTVQMQPFAPAGNAAPWWQQVAAYGITRAIDNRFAPPTVSGNVNAGSFAGQNGATYGNRPNNSGGAPGAGGDLSGLMLIALAGVVAFALIG